MIQRYGSDGLPPKDVPAQASTVIRSFTRDGTPGSPYQLGGLSRPSDLAPTAFNTQAQSAWSQATTNTTGANLNFAGGVGRRFYSAVSNVAGAVTVTTEVDGTAVALASGVDFTLGTDDTAPQLAVTATNLATAINANGTLSAKVTALASAEKVYIQRGVDTQSVGITTSAPGRMTRTAGEDGESVLFNPKFYFTRPTNLTADGKRLRYLDYNGTTGSMAFGPGAAAAGLGGSQNLWIGPDTGPAFAGSATAGDGNTAVGAKALWNFDSSTGIGDRNTAIGSEAYQDFGFGDDDCTVIGWRVGYYMRHGLRDTMIGSSIANTGSAAFGTQTGNDNVWVGYNVQSNFIVQSGVDEEPYPGSSVVIGSGANGNDRTVVIGKGAQANSSTAVYGTGTQYVDSIVIGNLAIANAANQLMIGSPTSSIHEAYIGGGIGKVSPSGLTINATGGSGTNNAAASLTFAAGKSTGSAVPPSIFFSTSTAAGSGTTLQTLSTRWQIDGANSGYLTGLAGTAIVLPEISTPATPAANSIVLYAKDLAGVSALYVKQDNGTETQLGGAAGSGDALVANPLSQFAATTSAQLLGVMSDETGSGALVFATSPTLVTPVLGVATATSINKVAFTAPATSATLTLADGKTLTASNTLTLAGTDGTTITFQGTDTYVGRATTDTLSNKRFTPRITTIVSSATPTINTDNCDAVTITALAAAITSMTTNLTGTPVNFDMLLIRIKDDGTGRAITWGASFASSQATLPTTTVASKVTTVGLIWDSVKAKWICIATDQEP